MKKRCLSILLAMCMVMTLLPISAFAADLASGTCGRNVKWVLDTDGTMTISGTGNMDNYDIYEGKPWRNYNYQIKKANILDGVTSVGRMAFWSTSLEEVTLPNSLLYIEDFAFSQTKLRDIVIPDSVKTIGGNTFTYSTDLITVVLGNGLTSLPESIFSGLSSLQTVVLSDNIKIIPKKAFFNARP